jgi:hypothetical protein
MRLRQVITSRTCCCPQVYGEQVTKKRTKTSSGGATKVEAVAKATAKFEAVAKATYSRKRTTTEVIPPDVTRAKAGAWLDLISPITEWAGLRGDALKYHRQQLRIQQEDSLWRLGEELRKKMAGLEVLAPIAPKILVPALEKASLEDPCDETMIERWANLLASATQKLPVQPRFVGILGELAGSQAECLEELIFQYSSQYEKPYLHFCDSSLDFSETFATRTVKGWIETELDEDLGPQEILNAVVKLFESPGAAPVVLSLDHDDDFETAGGNAAGKEDDLAILDSLGLIRHEALTITFLLKKKPCVLEIQYYHLTDLGVAFCEVCSRPRLLELQEIDDSQRARQAELFKT